MELVRDGWNGDDYNEFINYLFEIRDIKYKNFHSGLGIKSEVIGIRTPILKSMAKDISRGNYREFLELLRDDYYEETTLYGFIICNNHWNGFCHFVASVVLSCTILSFYYKGNIKSIL